MMQALAGRQCVLIKDNKCTNTVIHMLRASQILDDSRPMLPTLYIVILPHPGHPACGEQRASIFKKNLVEAEGECDPVGSSENRMVPSAYFGLSNSQCPH